MTQLREIWDIVNLIVWDTDSTKQIWMESISAPIPSYYSKVKNTQVMGNILLVKFGAPDWNRTGLGFQLVPKCQSYMAGHLTPGLSSSLGPPFPILTLWYPMWIYAHLRAVSILIWKMACCPISNKPSSAPMLTWMAFSEYIFHFNRTRKLLWRSGTWFINMKSNIPD